MSERIKGSACILSLWNGTDAYEPIACLTSNGLTESREAISTVTKCNPDVTETDAGAYSYEMPCEGLFIKPESGKFSWAELKALIRTTANAKVTWRTTTTYADATTLVEYGTSVITSLEQTSPAENEFITFSATFTGNGVITGTDPNA